jgi:hypothetical protein
MPVQTTLRTHTPPKFIAALREKDASLLLEQRLAHFIDWLKEHKDVELLLWTPNRSSRLTAEEKAELIREYVDS